MFRESIATLALASLVLSSHAHADCFAMGARARSPADLELVLFTAGLNHLNYPDTDKEAPPWKSVEAPIENAAEAVASRYKGDRIIVAITGNKRTDPFNDLEIFTADRFEHLLKKKGVPITQVVGESQFRVFIGSGYELLEYRFIRYPLNISVDNFNGFVLVHLRPLSSGSVNWRSPSVVLFVMRPPATIDGQVSQTNMRKGQFDYVARYIAGYRGTHRDALPILAGDFNATNVSPEASVVGVSGGFDWLTWQATCADGTQKVFGTPASSDIENIVMRRPVTADERQRVFLRPAWFGFSRARDGSAHETIKALFLQHEINMIGFEKTRDVPFCGPDQKICDDNPNQCVSRAAICGVPSCRPPNRDCGDGVCRPRNRPCPTPPDQ